MKHTNWLSVSRVEMCDELFNVRLSDQRVRISNEVMDDMYMDEHSGIYHPNSMPFEPYGFDIANAHWPERWVWHPLVMEMMMAE